MGKSKTNVAARAEAKAKAKAKLCQFCGKPVSVSLTLVGGRKKMVRNCCGKVTRARG